MRFQETLRRVAMIDEGFVQDEAGIGLGLVTTSALDPKTTALLQVAVLVALGSPAVSLEWSASRALAAGASEDEIADVLVAIAPVAGLGASRGRVNPGNSPSARCPARLLRPAT